MVKEIEISGISCRMKTSAAIPRIYRIKFGRDLIKDMKHLSAELGEKGKDMAIESLELFEDIAYLFHKHGDPSQPDSIEEWLEQFETFDIYTVLPELMEMWKLENATMSVAKKKSVN